ncbi:helix-turn-helix domain-containing protein [Micromonospora polyrhachis]|uniref:Transcriptional regulator with XRE-family HTH domain n=1 Tax=Micromonospora polyrhachis TaxID=1282883 RepID=A0A7W7SRL4_9ACTN|nr:helix-turn-helix transcriptional regulator [Micromonospora polyrhachis]MBB4959680.1 transcriptional regulator with XRE-family HTH domain [Micromonospora polyrhachis]
MANPKDLPRDIGGFIRDLRRNAKISLRQLAEQAGVSNPYLSQVERGLRKPSAEVLQQLANALRVSTPVMYLRAGLLDDKDGQGVLAAIATDPDLTLAQKQSLSQIYETFRRENIRHRAEAAEPSAEAVSPEVTTGSTGPAEPTAAAGGAARTTAGMPVDGVLESVTVTETSATPTPQTESEPVRTVGETTPAPEEEKR